MTLSPQAFKQQAREAVVDPQLRRALDHVKSGFINKRAKARARLPEFEALRDAARDIKNHTLAHLDLYLERYESKVMETGGQVHWCRDGEGARAKVLEICRQHGAKKVTKGKSMVSEEIGLNHFLEKQGIQPVETDLGEYIIQLRGETPSHIIAPAVHLTKDVIEADFRKTHKQLPEDRPLSEPRQLVDEARQVLRNEYLTADIGITGANFLVAETGSSIIVTNEGNGDLTQCLPKVHIVIASLEKVVPTLEDLSTILRVLARSATGQEMTSYTTLSTGPKRAEDPDGPEEYHVILLDNGRSAMLGGEFAEALRCIRCGACMNHCPVYHAIGGHAYGWVYPGPIGSVLTPYLTDLKEARDLPHASTLCGRCESVCPMRIPLPKMLRAWRMQDYEQQIQPAMQRRALGIWSFFAGRPGLYGLGNRMAAQFLRMLAGRKGRIASLPLAGGWTAHRDLPSPQGGTFQAQWHRKRGGKA
jgi:L-lactate dehydrogenase complex protein LldF